MSKTTDPSHGDSDQFTWPAVEFEDRTGKLRVVPTWFGRLVCHYTSHDWWCLAYPPARRWECHRCGIILEEAPTSMPDRRRVPRDEVKWGSGPSHS